MKYPSIPHVLVDLHQRLNDDAKLVEPATEKTKDFLAKLGDERVAAAKTQVAAVTTPRTALYTLVRHSFGKGLPRDEEVLAVMATMAKTAVVEVTKGERTYDAFGVGAGLLSRLDELDVEAPTERTAFEDAFGPAIVDQTLTGEKLDERFVQAFPDSKYSVKIKERRARATRAAEEDAERQAKAEEAEEKREAAAERGQCVARCKHKCMSPGFVDKDLCLQGCTNYECDQNYCVGACQADCSTRGKAGQPGCVQACKQGRCGQ